MKIGDLVEFTYGRVGASITAVGVFAGHGTCGKHKVLYMQKTYWVPASCIKEIITVRKGDVNEEWIN
jgi:hypothetical protein